MTAQGRATTEGNDMDMVDDGGPAFPIKEPTTADWGGMTLRDYFAAKAMQGFCGSGHAIPTRSEHYTNLAEDAYRLADAMLEARGK